ncbi:hypothetical protein PIB30_090768 [Stylosanthes scabra]|uniref:Uncharacterized protein n=1 Tax=Stylosanthes scabra TaxID=79078 RepID=A0ABU6WVN3_9FABA|nr:hypothetical protein [Stylosanthes scabra]
MDRVRSADPRLKSVIRSKKCGSDPIRRGFGSDWIQSAVLEDRIANLLKTSAHSLLPFFSNLTSRSLNSITQPPKAKAQTSAVLPSATTVLLCFTRPPPVRHCLPVRPPPPLFHSPLTRTPLTVVHRPLCCPVSIHRQVPRPFHSSSRRSAHYHPSSLLLPAAPPFLSSRSSSSPARRLRPSRSSSTARHLRPSGDRGDERMLKFESIQVMGKTNVGMLYAEF